MLELDYGRISARISARGEREVTIKGNIHGLVYSDNGRWKVINQIIQQIPNYTEGYV